MNCFIRIKWALTENNPVIKAYDETLWSDLPDSKMMPIEPSLNLLLALHYRLTYIMKNLSELDLEKSFIHPENNSEYRIKQIIGMYAWHGNHHLNHIIALKKHKNWNYVIIYFFNRQNNNHYKAKKSLHAKRFFYLWYI